MKLNLLYGIGLCLLWAFSILGLCYIPHQHEFGQIALYGIPAFLSYFVIVWKPQLIPLHWIVIIAIGIRILVIPFFPLLSDDIYRFIWDGRLWHLGINPFSHLPTHWISEGIMSPDLFHLLNSPEYHTIYPPIPQGIFYMSTMVSSSDYHSEALIMKFIHCVFEFGALRVLWLLLKKYELPKERWILYALNPLVILEVLANVHHEGIMIFFVLLCLLYLSQEKFYIAGITMALAIGSKLLPLLLCPVLFFYLKGRSRWQFTLGTLIASAILFGPLLLQGDVASHLLDSADLYVRSFEFNASIYYLINMIGQWVYGYNVIGTLGPLLKLITIGLILYISIRSRRLVTHSDLATALIGAYLVFVLLSSTVHPWYVLLLVGLAPLTKLRFPLIWSFLILGTYINYSFNPYQEQTWMVILEYTVLASILFIEYQRSHCKEKGPLPLFGK